MRKTISLMMALLLLSLTACGGADGDLLQPNTNGEAAGNGIQSAKVTVEQVVLLEQDGIKIQAKELRSDGFMGAELKVLIENDTDKDLTIQCRNSSVNGYMVETMFSPEVAAGKKANDAITFLSSDLELCGIETIADMAFSFHVFTTDGWDTVLDSQQVQLKTSAADSYSYTYDHPGTQVYEGSGIKLIAKGLNKEDSILGPGLVMYIHNAGDQAVTIQARDTSVNGFMIETVFSQEVMPGKHAVSAVTFMESDLEENGITQIQDLELSFHIFDTATWETIADTDPIKLSFNQ